MSGYSEAEFVRMVAYYAREGDATSFAGWDEARCARVMPSFYKAWKDVEIARDILERVARTYAGEPD